MKQVLPLLVVLMTFSIFAQERGVLIFSDNFDTPLTFAENWNSQVTNVKPVNKQVRWSGSGTLLLRRDTPKDFYAEVDFTFDSIHNPQGNSRAGFCIDGKYYLISPLGAIFGWRGEPIAGYEVGKPVKLTLIRKCTSTSAQYIFLVNGKEIRREMIALPTELLLEAALKEDQKKETIDDLEAMLEGNDLDALLVEEEEDDEVDEMLAKAKAPMPSKLKPLGIFLWSQDIRIDNFRLYALKDDNFSNNLIINSGFEYEQDGFPLYICRQGTFDYTKVDSIPYEDYLNTWSLDTKEKHSGRQSLKLVNNDCSKGQSLMMHSAGTMSHSPGVFSVWMKADQEDFPVSIGYANRKVVKVGTEWKRYEVVNPKLPKPGIYSPVGMSFREKKGTLWIDDMQAEYLNSIDSSALKAGKSLATPYLPSNLDKLKFRKKQTFTRVPEFLIPKLPSGLIPNGDLELWKDKATRLDKFYYGDKTPANKTEVFLACDANNLYLGYRCYVKDSASVNSEKFPRDSYKLFGSDSVEFFLNPEADSKFFQFAANAEDVLFDAGKNGDIPWNGNWKSVAKKNEKTNSIDYEITIPFAMLANPELKTRWLLNLCRNDGDVSEILTLAKTPVPMCKNTRTWPYAQFPSEIVRHYAIGAVADGFSNFHDGGIVSLDLQNNSGDQIMVKAELFSTGKDERLIGTKEVTLKQGANKQLFTVENKNENVRLKLLKQGKVVSNQYIKLEKRPLITMLGRLSYYMSESEAPFRVNTTLLGAENLTAVLTCGKISVKKKVGKNFTVALPLKDVPDGEHEVKLSMMQGDKVIAEIAHKLIKRPYKKGAVQINHFSRCVLLDGKGIVPICPFMGDLAFAHVFTKKVCKGITDFFVKYGFKFGQILIAPVGFPETIEKGQLIIEEALKNDFKIHLWVKYDDMTDEQIRKFVKEFDYPNIVAQQVADEPEITSITSDQLRDHVRRMKQFHLYNPVNICYTIMGIPRGFGGLEVDILKLDDYLTNMDYRTVYSVVANTDIMWKSGAKEGKPCWYTIVCANMPLHPREPSYAEQIAQSYGNIASGCTGLIYFYSPP